MKTLFAHLSLAGLCLLPALLSGVEGKKEDERFFEQRIQPLLRESCLKCHGGERIRNNLDVSTRADLLRGGDHGPALVPGEPEKSLLIKAVRYQDNLHMPPKGKLDARQIDDLIDWIKRGAPWK